MDIQQGDLRMKKTMNFVSRKKYLKWLAFGHMRTKTGKRAKVPSRSIFRTTPGHTKVKVRGKFVKVKHSKRR